MNTVFYLVLLFNFGAFSTSTAVIPTSLEACEAQAAEAIKRDTVMRAFCVEGLK